MDNVKSKVITSEFSLSDFSQLDDAHIKAKCRIAYAGKNRNYTDIPKETFDKALESLIHIPVVGNWLGENFGGHDIIMETKGNEFIVKDKTEAIGFVPESTEISWEEVEDENGNIKKYLTCDVILWNSKKPEEVAFIMENGVNQSMEIRINDYDWEEEYLVVKDFDFHALCVLGKDDENPNNNVEPCFEDAGISIDFSKDFNKELSSMINEFRKGETEMKNKEQLEFQLEEVAKFEQANAELKEQVLEFTTLNKELSKTLEEVEGKYNKAVEELEVLREFKANADKEQLETEIAEIKEEYSTLLDNEVIEEMAVENEQPEDLRIALSVRYATEQIERNKKEQEKKFNFVPKDDKGLLDDEENELNII